MASFDVTATRGFPRCSKPATCAVDALPVVAARAEIHGLLFAAEWLVGVWQHETLPKEWGLNEPEV
jgi:hypothetical protein